MYPAGFDYHAPESLEEAISKLSELGEDARVLAGGQSLIPMMKVRTAFPSDLVDINRLPGLDSIESSNGHLRIGALVRHADIVASEAVTGGQGTMASAAPWIADPIVRNLGTVCGSVAHCDPEGDWNSIMLAARADVVAAGPNGERVIPIDDFIVDFFTNALESGEIVTGVRVPKTEGSAGGAYKKLERKIGDYATVGVATQLSIGSDGKIESAGIALTSVNPKNTRATAAEEALVGETPSAELFEEAGALAAQAADPVADVRGSPEWKRNVVHVYTRRGLTEALAQAQS